MPIIGGMKWLKRKKEKARAEEDDAANYEEKLSSRMRDLPSAEFDDAAAVEARIRRMSYGAKIEHRPSWMAVDEWEQRDSA